MSIAVYGFGFFRPTDSISIDCSSSNSPPNWHFDSLCKKSYSRNEITSLLGPFSLTGDGVDIYVFSTGANINHSELQSRAELLPNYTSTLAADTVVSGVDCAQTGTALAVLCAGVKTGVAHNAFVYSAKITNELDEFKLEDFKLAVDAAISKKLESSKPSVALISYYRAPTVENRVVTSSDDEFEQTVSKLHQAGFIVVVPSGDGLKNNKASYDSISYLNSRVVSPARMEDVFTVGSIDSFADITKNGCYGEPIDAYGPGVGITTAKFKDPGYSSSNGSIYAAAIAAGCVALFLEKKPTATLQEYRLFARRHFPMYQPSNFPNTVMDEDAGLGAVYDFEYGLRFFDVQGYPVSYLPEPIAIKTVPMLKAFFVKGVLTLNNESGNLGTIFYPGNFRFQLTALSKNFYNEERPVEFYLVNAPASFKISRTTGTLYGEASEDLGEVVEFIVAVSDGVYCERKTYTLNVLPRNVQLSQITGKVLIKNENWNYLRDIEEMDSRPLSTAGVVYADKRTVVLLDKDSGAFLEETESDKRTGIFTFGMLPGNYQIIVKHDANERYQIKDLRVG